MIKSDLNKNNIRYIKILMNSHLKFKHRDDYLLEILKDKNIIHIGACDSPFTKKQYSDGNLLYQKLDKVVKEQIGIDIDEESVNYLNNQNFVKSKIIKINMDENINLSNLNFKPDYVLMGEVIEHLMNLETSLISLKNIMNNETKLIITTPNASRLDSFLSNFMNTSTEHEDHKVGFQLVNLINLLEANGLKIYDYKVSGFSVGFIKSTNIFSIFLRKLFTFFNLFLIYFFPLFGNTHIIICKKNN